MIAAELVSLAEVEAPGPRHVLLTPFDAELRDGTKVSVTGVLWRTAVAVQESCPKVQVVKGELLVNRAALRWYRPKARKPGVGIDVHGIVQRCATCRRTKSNGASFDGPEADWCLECEAVRAQA